MQKSPEKRYTIGLNMAADLSLALDYLETPQEKFSAIQQLDFFRNFTESEIWEIIHVCNWQEVEDGAEIIVEGEIDDSFYIVTAGNVEIIKE